MAILKKEILQQYENSHLFDLIHNYHPLPGQDDLIVTRYLTKEEVEAQKQVKKKENQVMKSRNRERNLRRELGSQTNNKAQNDNQQPQSQQTTNSLEQDLAQYLTNDTPEQSQPQQPIPIQPDNQETIQPAQGQDTSEYNNPDYNTDSPFNQNQEQPQTTSNNVTPTDLNLIDLTTF